MRALSFYLFSVAVLTVFAGQVDFRLKSLGYTNLAIELLLLFGAAFLARRALLGRVVESAPSIQQNLSSGPSMSLVISTQ